MIVSSVKKFLKAKEAQAAALQGRRKVQKSGMGKINGCFLLLLPSFLFWQNLGVGAGPSDPSGTPAKSNVGVAPSYIIRSVNVQF